MMMRTCSGRQWPDLNSAREEEEHLRGALAIGRSAREEEELPCAGLWPPGAHLLARSQERHSLLHEKPPPWQQLAGAPLQDPISRPASELLSGMDLHQLHIVKLLFYTELIGDLVQLA
ncbi:hypothetical protein ABZP36_008666 [Zizania latifolia]